MTAAPTTAHEVLALLKRHYLPEGRPPGVLWLPEIGAPDGRRRADLLAVPVSVSSARAGGGIVGHEIKVSRSDVLAELADPTKADPWLRYCSRWWLVVSDPALVDGLVVPEAWGIMAPPSGRRTRSMTILRPAPKLTPDGDLTPALTRIAAFVTHRVEVETRRADHAREAAERDRDRVQRTLDEARLAGELGRQVSPDVKRAHALVQRLDRERYRGTVYAGNVDDDLIVETILDRARVARLTADAKDDLARLIERARDPLGRVAEDLERLQGADR